MDSVERQRGAEPPGADAGRPSGPEELVLHDNLARDAFVT